MQYLECIFSINLEINFNFLLNTRPPLVQTTEYTRAIFSYSVS